MHEDSALALLAAARAADPSFLPAQRDYVWLRWSHGEYVEARRDFAVPDPRGGTVTECLLLATAAHLGSAPPDTQALAKLADLEPRDSSGCATGYLAELIPANPTSPSPEPSIIARRRRAVALEPEIEQNWEALAAALSRHDSLRAEATEVLREGLRHVPHPFQRAKLLDALVWLRFESNDTVEARELKAQLLTALARDGRAGMRLIAAGSLALDGLDLKREGLALFTAAGDWYGRWSSFRDIGRWFTEKGSPARALAPLDSAVRIADSVGRPWVRLVSRLWLGRAEAKAGRTRAAERDLRAAIAIGPAAGDDYYLAEAWHNLAHTYEGAGRWADAAAAADSFVAITRPMRFDPLRMMSLHDAATIRWEAGWHAAAEANFVEMVRVVDEQRDNYYWAGEYFERTGDLARALAYYQRAVHAPGPLPQHPDPLGLAGVTRVFEALGKDDSAARTAAAHDSLVSWWTPLERPLLPQVLARQGHPRDAVPLAAAWADRQLDGGNVQGAAVALLGVAELALAAAMPAEALAAAGRADSLARSLHLVSEHERAVELRGQALIALGDRSAGLAALEEAAAAAVRHPITDDVLTTQTALGDALAAAGRPAGALAAYDRAARTVERVTVGLRGDVDRAGYRERHLRPFDGALHVSLEKGDRDAAVLWSERRKAAALALAAADTAHAPALLDRAALQRRLGPREALVDYLVTDSLAAALVLTDSDVAVVPLAVTRDSLRVFVARLRRPLVTTSAGRLDLAHAEYDLVTAHALYDAVVLPLEPALTGRDRWFIIPDGPLYALSFQALVTNLAPATNHDYAAPAYLLDRIEVTYLPGPQFLAAPPERAATLAGASILAVAGSAPGSEREVALVRGAFSRARVRVLAPEAATETAVRTEGPSYAILHLATHAAASNTDPFASHLRLAADGANDGYWHASEIAATRWHTRLVVVSACETLGGRIYEGEGLMGLARAFLAGGAEAVVATQWPVGAASADVMETFYRRLAAGSAPAAALRDAQLALRRGPGTSHPFYWGGFVLIAR